MTELHEFDLGSGVLGRDGLHGKLWAVVIDPMAGTVTHLIVGGRYRRPGRRLVPIECVGSTQDSIRLVCDRAEFGAFPEAEWTQSVPALSAGTGYDRARVGAYSSYAVGLGRLGMGDIAGMSRQRVIRSRVPTDEETLRVGDRAWTTDGTIGRVQGIVTDHTDHRLRYVFVRSLCLRARGRIVIPVNAVTGWHHGVRFGLTRAEFQALARTDAFPSL